MLSDFLACDLGYLESCGQSPERPGRQNGIKTQVMMTAVTVTAAAAKEMARGTLTPRQTLTMCTQPPTEPSQPAAEADLRGAPDR